MGQGGIACNDGVTANICSTAATGIKLGNRNRPAISPRQRLRTVSDIEWVELRRVGRCHQKAVESGG
jgi:hypothetical protein